MPRVPAVEGFAMGTVGVVLVGVGLITAIVAFVTRRSSRSSAGEAGWWSNVQELPASAARTSSGAAVAINGTAVLPETAEGPLTEPLSGQPCVWWCCVGAAHWQEHVPHMSANEGEQRESLCWEARSSQLARSESDTPFEVEDRSGRVWVSPKDVRAEDVSRSAARCEDVPTNGFLVKVGPVSFTADEHESRRGYYVEHVCEYIPAGSELVVSGRVRRSPTGIAIGPDAKHGLQLCSSDFVFEQRGIEAAVARAPGIATAAAAAIALAGGVVFMLA